MYDYSKFAYLSVNIAKCYPEDILKKLVTNLKTACEHLYLAKETERTLTYKGLCPLDEVRRFTQLDGAKPWEMGYEWIRMNGKYLYSKDNLDILRRI